MASRDRASLINLYEEQLDFLRASAAAYDQGFEAEAKRLAVTVRTLVHDTPRSKSLLTQLGVKEALHWWDTAEAIIPANLLPTNGLGVVHVRAGGGVAATARYIPRFMAGGERNGPRRLAFGSWWSDPVTKDERGHVFGRRDFVLTVANKEGGAHVDPSLNAAYQALAEENSLGIWVAEGPPGSAEQLERGRAAEGNSALASVRQVVWELMATLDEQAAFLIYAPGDARRPTSSLDGTSRCPCGSGKALARCHFVDADSALDLGNAMLDAAPLDAAFAYEHAEAAGNKKAPFNLGLAMAASGDYAGAELAFERAMALGDGWVCCTDR